MEGEICHGSAVAYGAMHPKGTCSASLHCVGIAPYGREQGVRLHIGRVGQSRPPLHTF